jgi:Amt family ammonium transporter
MTLNDGLAGLVAITAPCAYVSVRSAFVIGVIAGVLVVLSVFFFDKVRVDDPVGALSVHLVNGVFGTLAVGLFADPTVAPSAAVVKPGLLMGGGLTQLLPQIYTVLRTAVYVFGASLIAWSIIKADVGIRGSRAEELEGLDVGEHGNAAYLDFRPAETAEV